MSVEVEYFFPVSVLAALTVTPGSGTFPDFTAPLISPKGAAVMAEEDTVGTGGDVTGTESAFDCDGGCEAGAAWFPAGAGGASWPYKAETRLKTTIITIGDE